MPTLALPHGYDLPLVCGDLSRGRHDPTANVTRHELWHAANTIDGPATLHVRVDGAHAHVRAWGSGADALLERTPAILGLCDEPDALCTDDPLVASWQCALPALRLGAAGSVADVAARAVVEQRVTGIEARRTWFGLVRRFGAAAPGPHPTLRLPPAPHVLAELDDRTRRGFGLEARRGLALARVGREAARIERAAHRGPGVLDRVLRAIPGIGPWTSATVRDTALGDPDAVVVGDWHVGRQVVFAFTGRRGGDDAEMLALLEPFAGQRGRVARLALACGAPMARRLPHAEIPDLVRRELRGERYRVRNSLRFR